MIFFWAFRTPATQHCRSPFELWRSWPCLLGCFRQPERWDPEFSFLKILIFYFLETYPNAAHLLGKELHLLFETKLCTVWWPLWKEEHQEGGIYLFLQHNLKAGEKFRWICKFDSKPVESFFSCFSCSILWRGSLRERRINESWNTISCERKVYANKQTTRATHL